jgi:hypothetical protein
MKLLTRDEFRNSVFKRDNNCCVVCKTAAKDAHHIIERRLFPDGGYYIDNGASVCEKHHIECEETLISVEAIRAYAGIDKKVLPPHLYDDEVYDKWGNIILPNGGRLKGELFYDESVQKILGKVLGSFTDYVKYPRTYHLPWSEGMNDDDRQMQSTEFGGKIVVVTEKMDGENTTMYRDHIHARSIDSGHHPSRSWVKNFWNGFRYDIPTGWRVCGENLYAKHSIGYSSLESFFLGFSVWDDRNNCLSWDDTKEWFSILGIKPVQELYRGMYDELVIKSLYKPNMYDSSEGYVIRTENMFQYRDFRKCVGKFVRKNHVMTTKHWMHGQAIEPNKLGV